MVIDNQNTCLTIFFIALTLSVGLVSVNLPLSSYAQNNALSQKENGDSEEQMGQLQSSDHNGQVVSGDMTVLSGNNLLCQVQDNSDDLQVLTGMCSLGETIPLNIPPGTLVITTDSNVAGRLFVTDDQDQSVREAPFRDTFDQNRFQITRDHSYTVKVVLNSPSEITFESNSCLPAVPPSDFCGGIMKLPVAVGNVVIR